MKRLRHLAGLNDRVLDTYVSLRHPEWVYKLQPLPPVVPEYAPPVPSDDQELCERLITAYHRAPRHEPQGMWADITEIRHTPLLSALQVKCPKQLQNVLDRMFQADLLFGIATNALSATRHPVQNRVASAYQCDGIVSLAEYLGVIPVENPEQGHSIFTRNISLAEVVYKIEEATGVRFDFPLIGQPHGIYADGRFVSHVMPEHFYVADRIRWALDGGDSIAEIGAGFGGTALWAFQLIPGLQKYVIYDLPQINVVQGYFLSKALGANNVSLYGEERKSVVVSPCTDIPDEPFALMVNENSMPEIPAETVRDYLRWGARNCQRFYSYNHEAINPTQPQVMVRDEVKEVGGYNLLSRTPSWMRRGYVEELYEVW